MRFLRKSVPIISAVLSLCVILSACGKDPEDPTATTEGGNGVVVTQNRELKLPYNRSDSLNPYKSTGLLNFNLSTLIYDGLFALDESYKPIPVLAEDYNRDGLNLEVKLKDGVMFSSGEKVTADDVIYSFNQARSSPNYSARLSNFSWVKKTGELGLVFILKSPSPFGVNCLNFPIIKKGDNSPVPAGSGRYILSESEGVHRLVYNPSRVGGFEPSVKNILLADSPESQALAASLQIGNIDCAFFDMSDGVYRRTEANAFDIGLNNLVFLGFNVYKAGLQNPAVRKAAAMLTDRKVIAETAFQRHARPAFTAFNPDFYDDTEHVYQVNPEAAIQLLVQAGFDKVNNEGVRFSPAGGKLSFSLVVNEDNPLKTAAAAIIKDALAQAGISVQVTPLKFEEYTAAIQARRFDMYIGEVMLNPDMHLSPFLSPGGALSFGIDPYGSAAQAYSGYLAGEVEMHGFIDTFNEDPPFIPLCYRNGVVAYNRKLNAAKKAISTDLFFGIDSWAFS